MRRGNAAIATHLSQRSAPGLPQRLGLARRVHVRPAAGQDRWRLNVIDAVHTTPAVRVRGLASVRSHALAKHRRMRRAEKTTAAELPTRADREPIDAARCDNEARRKLAREDKASGKSLAHTVTFPRYIALSSLSWAAYRLAAKTRHAALLPTRPRPRSLVRPRASLGTKGPSQRDGRRRRSDLRRLLRGPVQCGARSRSLASHRRARRSSGPSRRR